LTFGFERPQSGPGLVGHLSGRIFGEGNYNNPNLNPAAAAVVKQRAEMLQRGVDYPYPSLNCLPMVALHLPGSGNTGVAEEG
jgi:hypothetical protein